MIVKHIIKSLGYLQERLYKYQGVPTWRSFDGRVRPIKDLSDSHLVSIIAKCIRERSEIPDAVLEELAKRKATRERHRHTAA